MSTQAGEHYSFFVDQSETALATIGSNYLQNYLTFGKVDKGIGVLTEKRFYYKGKGFAGSGKHLFSATREGLVSIEDITETMFTHIRHVALLPLGIIAIVLSLCYLLPHFIGAIFLTVNSDGSATGSAAIGAVIVRMISGQPVLLAIIFAGIVSIILYFVTRKTLFTVSFAGGSFSFNVSYYPMADIQDFQRQLHLLKDHLKNG